MKFKSLTLALMSCAILGAPVFAEEMGDARQMAAALWKKADTVASGCHGLNGRKLTLLELFRDFGVNDPGRLAESLGKDVQIQGKDRLTGLRMAYTSFPSAKSAGVSVSVSRAPATFGAGGQLLSVMDGESEGFEVNFKATLNGGQQVHLRNDEYAYLENWSITGVKVLCPAGW